MGELFDLYRFFSFFLIFSSLFFRVVCLCILIDSSALPKVVLFLLKCMPLSP